MAQSAGARLGAHRRQEKGGWRWAASRGPRHLSRRSTRGLCVLQDCSGRRCLCGPGYCSPGSALAPEGLSSLRLMVLSFFSGHGASRLCSPLPDGLGPSPLFRGPGILPCDRSPAFLAALPSMGPERRAPTHPAADSASRSP